MSETLITCPNCDKAKMTASIKRVKVDAGQLNPIEHYMVLCCLNCNNKLQFVIDLTPSFDRSDVACASV